MKFEMTTVFAALLTAGAALPLVIEGMAVLLVLPAAGLLLDGLLLQAPSSRTPTRPASAAPARTRLLWPGMDTLSYRVIFHVLSRSCLAVKSASAHHK
jgi:hypothetical protein